MASERDRRSAGATAATYRAAAADPVPRRGSSLALTAALAAILVAMVGGGMLGSLLSTRATYAHEHSLTVDALFGEARNSIALEEVNVRHYEVEPSVALRGRFDLAASATRASLARLITIGPDQVRADAQRLVMEHMAYQRVASRMLDLVADQDPAHVRLDRLSLTPAYYTLQQDIDGVARAYHGVAERQAAGLRRAQTRILLGNVFGGVVGVALVAMIWRIVLGYQRRLITHAVVSQRQALHDTLTGLPNRALFARELRTALDETRRAPDGHPLAVMIVDLNGFKAVNDTLGHQGGDELLVAVGRRMRRAVNASDVVSRLGGDEFGVLLPDVPSVAAARLVADRIHEVLRQDFGLTAGPAAVSGSIGVVVAGTGEVDELVRHADTAMYRAKSAGGGVAVFDPSLDAEAPDRMGLFADLRGLLASGDPQRQLRLHFQPLVRIADGTVDAVEALVRWRHPVRGQIMPAEFLPMAEARGLEMPLTYHLLSVAVGQAARWQALGKPLRVSVNVSPRCLLDEDFAARVAAAIERSGLAPDLLRLEITETSMMVEPERTVAVLKEVHGRGVSVSVDDFGNGFSSLSQLKQLPADELKIDRAFIRDLVARGEDQVVVGSTVELAHNLGLTVVAEGVETLAALAYLSRMRCDYAQGFALSRPVPAKGVPAACARAGMRVRQALADAASQTVPTGKG